ncbi:hypothetical protein LUZ60_001112 [Juncus effusus]|nr:hypothetical protein LUZ60_001112 [Juncus effusus]
MSRSNPLKGLNMMIGSSICIFGFFIFTASLYFTLDLYLEKGFDNGASNGDLGLLKITIFSAPKPRFLSDGSNLKLTWARQELAVRSWLAIASNVNVVLFGRDESIVELKKGFGSRVSIDPLIDFTFLGTPFFHSMVERAQASDSDISILIDPETILFPEILKSLSYAQKLSQNWFVFSVSHGIFNFPYQLSDSTQQWLKEDGTTIKTKKLYEMLVKKSKGMKCGEKFLMAFNNPKFPLFQGIIPPFLYNKGLHDIWLINEILSSEMRTVFDASDRIFNIYPQTLGKFPRENNTNIKQIFEYNNNLHLATFYGSLYFHKTFMQNKPHEILKIEKKKKKNNKCSLSRFGNITLTTSVKIGYRYDLESILEKIADKNKSVILGIAGESYKDMLMNWVCRFRNLNITNFLVYALDLDTYEFSILQGLPVFMDTNSPTNISFNDCHFGTECFQRVTKVKSRIVLKILKLGFNVVMSDVDVYWFRNPLPYLSSFGFGVLLAQSDEFNETGPINLPRKLNSGFYFAKSDPKTINAIELVVKHAASSNLSEQPSFYDILCGQNGVNRFEHNQCIEPNTNLKVIFLDRDLFPNGAYKGIWEKKNVRLSCESIGCFVLHNNWISGRKRKLERQISSGLWDYDPSSRMCVWNWSDATLANYL